MDHLSATNRCACVHPDRRLKMNNVKSIRIAGKTAIVAALMGGSSLAFAQDAAPSVPTPAAPVAVTPAPEPAFTPPPAVTTLPTENDVVNPAAAQEAAVEAAEKREARAVATPVARPRATAQVETPVKAPAPAAAVAPYAIGEPSTDIASPAVDAIEPADTVVDDGAAIAPADETAGRVDARTSNEDLTLVGGIAAALAAIGLGAAFASRRRRRVVADDRVESAPEYVAPRPIREDPAFQQFAATPTPERVIHRKPVMTRPDVPVTDPLFSTPVMAGPITDPLFAPRNDVELPITDPLFAKHDRFAGLARTTAAREPELVN
jgi:hypothetical protein